MKRLLLKLLLLVFVSAHAQPENELSLRNDKIRLVWQHTIHGWQVKTLSVSVGQNWVEVTTPSGENTLLFSEEKPSTRSDSTFRTITGVIFPEANYKTSNQLTLWEQSISPVALNTAGTAYYFFPAKGEQLSLNKIRFQQEAAAGTITTEWSFDPYFPGDILVSQTLQAKRAGYFSLATPTLASVPETELTWATVPGYFQGNRVEKNFVLAYGYGHGIPDLPVIYRERCASTLCPMITASNGITFSVIPAPGLARDPWEKDAITHAAWHLGLSHKNRKAQFSPTLYYPVLGEPGSALRAGDVINYQFRYSLGSEGWFSTLNHAVYDIYQFREGLQMRQNKQSLTTRIEQMHHYLTDTATSMWKVEAYKGMKIGAQSYLGGVEGSDRDAMKNADYGAMWMLGTETQDPELTRERLPYALNFKLAQQQTAEGFFRGAAIGQYYLAKSKKFVEEWGEVVEPIGLTYYTMVDIGNILLFEPGNKVLQERLQMGAETLLKWQKADGSWAVAYDRPTRQEVFKDLKDLRPTFYGLLVAYRLLKKEKYLIAAKKGADWLINNGIRTGSFLGVCGDARYASDFATVQTAGALLELYNVTHDETYKEAAITTARIYTASVYTHPIPGHQIKEVKGVQREDWEIAQAGLSFEHGGVIGSANRGGPILLASHAGLFIRIFQLTGDSLFVDMARAAAIGRDAFVDPATSVASYYWNAMNRGPGLFPHHAWWQIGWITDYLLSEANLRSGGKISFPYGFMTPKVGPHVAYGFAAGEVFGSKARLVMHEGLISGGNPSLETITAASVKGDTLFIMVLNGSPKEQTGTFILDPDALAAGRKVRLAAPKNIPGIAADIRWEDGKKLTCRLPAWGMSVVAIKLFKR